MEIDKDNDIEISPMLLIEEVGIEQVLKKFHELSETFLSPIEQFLSKIIQEKKTVRAEELIHTLRDVQQVKEILTPIREMYILERALRENNKVLLAATDRKLMHYHAKIALKSLGADLITVDNVEEGKKLVEEHLFAVICIDPTLIELANLCAEKSQSTRIVLMVPDKIDDYLTLMQNYPFVSNVIAYQPEDQLLFFKNLITTVKKLITQDIFGIYPYLGWNPKVWSQKIVASNAREKMILEMEETFKAMGIRQNIISIAASIAEELLMNAFYDAPTDAKGNSLYNHLQRTHDVVLEKNQQGTFRYACDGFQLALSVEDPFGSFSRETLLNYLIRCQTGFLANHENKGGAGRGLFSVLEQSDYFIINVQQNKKTEVIAIINLLSRKRRNSSVALHFFWK